MAEDTAQTNFGKFDSFKNTIKIFDKEIGTFVDKKVTAVHGYDVDGTLSPPNQEIPKHVSFFIGEIQRRFGVVGVLSSGKSAPYLENEADKANIYYWLAENHAVVQKKGEQPKILGENLESLITLRNIINLGPRDEGIQKITLLGRQGEVVVEPGKDGVLTLFTEQGPVLNRWAFNEEFTRQEVTNELRRIVKEKKLKLFVMDPHGDGAVDIVRLDKYNRPIDKTNFQSIMEEIFGIHFNMAFFGDGNNDLPAMSNSEIVGVTFANAPQDVKNVVMNKGFKGYISPRPGPEGGLYQGVIWLAKSGFYGTNKQAKEIKRYGEEYLEKYLSSQTKIFAF